MAKNKKSAFIFCRKHMTSPKTIMFFNFRGRAHISGVKFELACVRLRFPERTIPNEKQKVKIDFGSFSNKKWKETKLMGD
jgi:hypothetical protein